MGATRVPVQPRPGDPSWGPGRLGRGSRLGAHVLIPIPVLGPLGECSGPPGLAGCAGSFLSGLLGAWAPTASSPGPQRQDETQQDNTVLPAERGEQRDSVLHPGKPQVPGDQLRGETEAHRSPRVPGNLARGPAEGCSLSI